MARQYSLEGRLGRLLVRGAELKGNVAESVLSARLDMSTSEVTQLDLRIAEDASFSLLRSGLFDAGTPSKRGAHVSYAGLDLEVRAVEIEPVGVGHVLTVTARSIGAGNMKRARGHKVQRNITPTQFVGLLARDAGLKFVGQPSAKRATVDRRGGEERETSWEAAQRYASELGYLCFETAGVLYFGKPTWLVNRSAATVLPVRWRAGNTDDAIDELPRCRRSGDDPKKLATVTASLRGELGELARPGHALALSGVPQFSGRYIVDSVTYDLAEGVPATVSASTPVNPEPSPEGTSATSTAGTGGGAGRKSAEAFVSLALDQAGKRYVFGAEVVAADANPNAFDCSELIEWCLSRIGVTFVDGSAAQIARCKPITVAEALKTRGALLYHPGHIAISLGNGRETIEAANSRVGVVQMAAGNRFTRAGLVPGLTYR